MLPVLTFTPRRTVLSRRRLAIAAAGTSLLVTAIVSTLVTSPPGSTDEAPLGKSLAERLSMSSWAIAVPTGWLAAPLAEVRSGDSVDLLAVRSGERPFAVAIAADLRVISADERAIVFEVDEAGATAIATARASGLLIIPLLRSTE